MTQDMNDLERDIEESRARLDDTIDRLQDKLSVSGIVDDLLGSARGNSLAPVFDDVMSVIKRNPVPVMLIAAGVGWLLHRTSQDTIRRRRIAELARQRAQLDASDAPVLNTGQSRIYEPELPLQPDQDTFDIRRKIDARA